MEEYMGKDRELLSEPLVRKLRDGGRRAAVQAGLPGLYRDCKRVQDLEFPRRST